MRTIKTYTGNDGTILHGDEAKDYRDSLLDEMSQDLLSHYLTLSEADQAIILSILVNQFLEPHADHYEAVDGVRFREPQECRDHEDRLFRDFVDKTSLKEFKSLLPSAEHNRFRGNCLEVLTKESC